MLKVIVVLMSLAVLSPAVVHAGYDPAVKEVQQKLDELGFEPGPIDGYWGKRTADAIKAYQRSQGFAETGKLDKKTAMALGVEIFTLRKSKAPNTLVEAPIPYVAPSKDCYAAWKCPAGVSGCSSSEGGKWMIPARCIQ